MTAPSDNDFRFLFDFALDGILLIGADGRILGANPKACEMLGYTREELERLTTADVVAPEDLEAHLVRLEASRRTPIPSGPRHLRRKDGTILLVEGSGIPTGDGRVAGILRDVTEQQRAEEALRHSEEKLLHAQRLESVGRLAGGVAHDFNNLLTVILAYSEQLMVKLGSGHRLFHAAAETHKAAGRAAELTRQLLAFSRRQVLEPCVIDLNTVIAEIGPMMRRLIGEHIDLLLHPSPEAGRVRADRGQLEQVIMNLVVNARDAMPNGGRLAIATREVRLDEPQAARLGLAPGDYVTLEVSDSGTGMDADTQAKLFEPFFTTKPRGEGTGLGLATVYGIVQQSGGAIEVESELGEGTAFTIYLPRTAEGDSAPDTAPAADGLEAGFETVLMVEDDAVVRALMSELLTKAGYRVLEAAGGSEALELAAGLRGEIHLLLTDVVMPGMSGRELAERLGRERPAMRVLFVSGYTQDLIARHGVLEPGVQLLQKPFAPAAFVRKIRQVLDAPGRAAA